MLAAYQILPDIPSFLLLLLPSPHHLLDNGNDMFEISCIRHWKHLLGKLTVKEHHSAVLISSCPPTTTGACGDQRLVGIDYTARDGGPSGDVTISLPFFNDLGNRMPRYGVLKAPAHQVDSSHQPTEVS